MKIQYFILTYIIILSCGCKRKAQVKGIVTLNENGQANSSVVTAGEVPKSPSLIQPRILIAPKPVDNNETKSNSSVVHPPVVPIVAKDPLPPLKILPVVASNNLTVNPIQEVIHTDPLIVNVTNPCTRIMCPLTGCRNSLPAIPSQGICCTRCVTNTKCNVSQCPALKCVGLLTPANFTAGDCCDRCAPIPTKPTEATTTTTTAVSSSESSSGSNESSGNDNENGKDHGFKLGNFVRQQKKFNSRIMHMVKDLQSRLRDHESDESSELSETEEDK
jgi:hypothetical protein